MSVHTNVVGSQLLAPGQDKVLRLPHHLLLSNHHHLHPFLHSVPSSTPQSNAT